MEIDLVKIRNLRHVRRFNYHHCNKYLSVAEHSYFVSLLVSSIAWDLDLDLDEYLAVLNMALLHDAEEAVTGDIGFLVKRRLDMTNLEDEASAEIGIEPRSMFTDRQNKLYKIVEFADCLELKMYLEEERLSGNRGLIEIEKEIWARLIKSDLKDTIKVKYLKLVRPVQAKNLPNEICHSVQKNLEVL